MVEEDIIEALPLRNIMEQALSQWGIPEEMDIDITERWMSKNRCKCQGLTFQSFPIALGETHTPSPGPPDSTVRIRLYNRAKDWHHTREIDFQCDNDGSIDLLKLQKKLETGKLQVCEHK